MLIDEVEITIKAGDGGAGIVSFGKLEKSGPDGGNGGDGGNVYIVAESDLTLLDQFRSHKSVSADDGARGGRNKKSGKKAENLVLHLPVGSHIIDLKTGQETELDTVGKKIAFCIGGRGGVGNFEMRSSSNTTPKNTIPPTQGDIKQVKINLKFIADYGLIGLPSAGKSSLLNELTNAKAKTAEYHFTTLSPNLGVLQNLPAQAGKKIIADIPGLIEGASEGKGLGIKFLKHIQKVNLLLHCIASDSDDPISSYKIIRGELKKYDTELLNKREIILITKSDLVSKSELIKIKAKLTKLGKKIMITSIHDEESIDKLLFTISS